MRSRLIRLERKGFFPLEELVFDRRMRVDRRKKVIAGIMIAGICGLSFLCGVYIIRQRMGNGIILMPSQSYEVCEIPYYLQNDDRWAKDKLGTSAYQMSSSGCLTTAIAASLSAQAQPEDKGHQMTPGELNQIFSKDGVYNAAGDIMWANIPEALPDAEVYVAPFIKDNQVEQYLSEGRYPLIKVKMNGTGAKHWLVIIGADESGYLCLDPLNSEKAPVSLSKHGNKAYSMRVVYWNQ